MEKISATFRMEKMTKNTIRFEENVENEFTAPKIGSVYIPKSTIGLIGWDDSKDLVITVEAKAK